VSSSKKTISPTTKNTSGTETHWRRHSSWISSPTEATFKALYEETPIPRPDQDRALHEVIKDFGECLSAGGSHREIDERDLYDESFRRLIAWAKEKESFFEGLQPLKEGGREHDLIFDAPSASWLKFTQPSPAGYCVSFDFGEPSLELALPLEYLERLGPVSISPGPNGDRELSPAVSEERAQPWVAIPQYSGRPERSIESPARHSILVPLRTSRPTFQASRLLSDWFSGLHPELC